MMASVQGTAGITRPLIRTGVPKQGQAVVALRQCVVFAFPLLAYLSYGLLLLRLVRPRPAWREVFKQPGCTACLAVAVALPVITWTEQIALEPIPLIAVAGTVAAVWLGQALVRHWRPEPSWVDQTGRVLGLCWLLVGLIALL